MNKKIPENAKKVFGGIIFDVYQWEQEMYDGSKQIFEGIKAKPGVEIYAITSEGKILILEEEQPHRGKFIGFPAGGMEDGEEPILCAKRELLEETGYEGDFEFIEEKEIFDWSKLDMKKYIFIAKNCEKICSQKLDPGEKINVLEYSFGEFLELKNNKLTQSHIIELIKKLEENEEFQKDFLNKTGIKKEPEGS